MSLTQIDLFLLFKLPTSSGRPHIIESAREGTQAPIVTQI